MMRNGIVGYESTIQGNSLTVEDVGKSFIGGGWVAQTAGCQRKARDEIFVQLAVQSEANANARPIAVRNAALVVSFAADPHIATEAKAANQSFESAQLPAFVLGFGID